MKILLFGVSNVGKSVTGELLAKKLNYDFYDLDDEVKKHLKITLEEFVSTGSLIQRDQIRCNLIQSLISKGENKVIAVTPLSYMQTIQPLLSNSSVLAIELFDSPECIFDRLVFSDENDIAYKDDAYKNKHKKHYLSEIRKDLKWYGFVYQNIEQHFNMNGQSTEEVVNDLISKFHLTKLET
ncbi:MAG: shikimate kinase [Lachnospiraceae bacterium]